MCRGHRSFGGAVPDYSAGFSLPMPDAETSISEEPGARKGHAGICAGAARATGRPTAMAHPKLRAGSGEVARLLRAVKRQRRSKHGKANRAWRSGFAVAISRQVDDG